MIRFHREVALSNREHFKIGTFDFTWFISQNKLKIRRWIFYNYRDNTNMYVSADKVIL